MGQESRTTSSTPTLPRGLREFTAHAAVLAAALSAMACAARDTAYGPEAGGRASELVRSRIESDAGAAKRTRELLSKPITAESAVQIALLNNQGLQAVYDVLGDRRAELVSALAGQYSRFDPRSRFQLSAAERGGLELDPVAFVPRLVSTVSRRITANAELDAAAIAVTGSALDIAFLVRTAFYRHQAAKQIVTLRRAALDGIRAAYALAQDLHTEGRISDLELSTEQTFLEDCRLLVSQAEEALLGAREDLNMLMGLSGRAARWRAADWLPEPSASEGDLDTLEERALAASLDLALASARLRAAIAAKRLAENAGPRASVRHGRQPGARGPVPSSDSRASVTPVPSGHGEATLAESELQRQRRVHDQIALRVRAQVRMSTSRLLITRERVRFYRLVILPLRKKVVQETQLEFNETTVGLIQLLHATRAHIESMRAYIETVRDYWIARAAIDQLLAGRLPRLEASAEGFGPRANGGPSMAP